MGVARVVTYALSQVSEAASAPVEYSHISKVNPFPRTEDWLTLQSRFESDDQQKIRIGSCAWSLKTAWRFYPSICQKVTWLEFYATIHGS